jgi:hypothetical protein
VYNTSNSDLPNNWVWTLAIEGSNKWIGTYGGGLAKYDGKGWTVYNISNSSLPSNVVFALAIEGSNKWIGTYGGGLAKYDGTTWTVFNTSNSDLPGNNVYALAYDGNNIWIGTDDGLAVYNTTGIEENSEPSEVQSLRELKVEPNPVFGNAVIKYGLPEKTNVSLELYDISGRVVKTIYSGVKEKGYYEANIEENELSVGVYFIRLETGSHRDIKKLIIM